MVKTASMDNTLRPEIGLRLEKGFNRAHSTWECEHKIVIVLYHD